MLSASITDNLRGIEGMLRHQQDLAEAAQAQLHALRQCNDRIAAELLSMKKAHDDSISVDDLFLTDHPSTPPLPQPLGPQAVAAPGDDQRETSQPSDTGRSAALQRSTTGAAGESRRGEHPPGVSRILEIAKSLDLDFASTEAAEAEADATPHWIRFVQSGKFDMIIGSVIVANTIAMSLQLEVEGWAIKPGECDLDDCTSQVSNDAFLVCENIFTAIFALELILRLGAHGMAYLRVPANLADFLIVIISSLDCWVLTPIGSEVLANVGVLRLLRLMRLAKVMRVVRVMNAFRPLRVIVSAVVGSVGALAWSMTLLFVLILMFAILMAQLVRSAIEDDARSIESRTWLWDKFGTWYHSMFTVFEMTMAPGGFINYRRLVEDIGPLMGGILVIYVCSVTFAVIRVITAMFLKATLSASDKDEATEVYEKSSKLEEYFRELQRGLEMSREPGSPAENAMISETDLKELLAGPGMNEWFGLVGLSTADAVRLHRSMAKGSGMVQLSDFVTVLLRMRGSARASELIVLLYETRAISDRLFAFQSGVAAVERDMSVKPLYSSADLPLALCAV